MRLETDLRWAVVRLPVVATPGRGIRDRREVAGAVWSVRRRDYGWDADRKERHRWMDAVMVVPGGDSVAAGR